MENQLRRRPAQIQDKENIYNSLKGKANLAISTKKQGEPLVRGALRDINTNAQTQREIVSNIAVAEFEKKENLNQAAVRSNCSHVQSKVDTAPPSRSALGCEESTVGLAASVAACNNMIQEKENIYGSLKGKANLAIPTKKQGLAVRGALSDINTNVQTQREIVSNIAVAEFEKKENLNQAAVRSNCSHVQSKVDTAPPSQSALGCEESTVGLAASVAACNNMITLGGKSLPPGLAIQLPREGLRNDPETCYCITLLWTPTQQTAVRRIQLTNDDGDRYDVIVVLQTVGNIKGKAVKGFKTTPGKMTKKNGKNSSASIYKKKFKSIYRNTLQKQRKSHLDMNNAALLIPDYYKRYRETKMVGINDNQLPEPNVSGQGWNGSICKSVIMLTQQKVKALIAMKKVRQTYLLMRDAAVIIQTRFRAYTLMKNTRVNYMEKLVACRFIQRYYRAYKAGTEQRKKYLKLKKAAICLQRRYRAVLFMKRERNAYLTLRASTIIVQRRFRARCLMLKERQTYSNILKSCITIQGAFRAYISGKQLRQEYINIRSAVILIQRRYRLVKETKKIYNDYQKLGNAVLNVQRRYRANKTNQIIRQNKAARKIQHWYLASRKRDVCRQEFLTLKKNVTIIQSIVRMHIFRKRFIIIRNATLCIQRYYRSYKVTTSERNNYLQTRHSIIKVQSYVRSFIAKRRFCKLRSAKVAKQAAKIRLTIRAIIQMKITQQFRKDAALCSDKYTQSMSENIQNTKEEKRRYRAASKIQALFRGHLARVSLAHDKRVAELRRKWRDGGLKSTQESMKERNEKTLEILRNKSSLETVIKALKTLKFTTEIMPMLYNENASAIVHTVYTHMSLANRSISGIEVLMSAATVLVNLTRYSITGSQIYMRDRIPPILKFLLRFSNNETQLFCILATYLWLFSKYENVKKDLIVLLNKPENNKILLRIKNNIDRTKRITINIMKNKFHTQQPTKSKKIILPALEPDYGIVRDHKPRFFKDSQQAIYCLFNEYKL